MRTKEGETVESCSSQCGMTMSRRIAHLFAARLLERLEAHTDPEDQDALQAIGALEKLLKLTHQTTDRPRGTPHAGR